MDSDEQIRQRIAELVEKQHALRQSTDGPGDAERDQLAAMEVEQDRLWDLLRQREALRDAGADPDQAHERAASEVENYRQ
ncbi:MAG: DUF2630 family protein [Geodermatophilaceae bacterium]